jgi:hypothetical protein
VTTLDFVFDTHNRRPSSSVSRPVSPISSARAFPTSRLVGSGAVGFNRAADQFAGLGFAGHRKTKSVQPVLADHHRRTFGETSLRRSCLESDSADLPEMLRPPPAICYVRSTSTPVGWNEQITSHARQTCNIDPLVPFVIASGTEAMRRIATNRLARPTPQRVVFLAQPVKPLVLNARSGRNLAVEKP